MDKLVSVIMSVFNEEESDLTESIDSILNQTHRNIEFIIVDDNPSNQQIKGILEHYAETDKRIKLVNNDENLGLANSLNRALNHVTGEYVARMDADDISFPERIHTQLDYLENHPDCDMVSSNRVDIDENGDLIGSRTDFRIDDDRIEDIQPFGSVIIHPTVMLRKSLYIEMKGYNNFRAAQDYDLWLRIIGAGKRIHIIPECLLKYRIRTNSITKANFARQYFYTRMALDKFYARKNGSSNDLIYSDKEINEYMERKGINNNSYIIRLNALYNSLHDKSLPKYKRAWALGQGLFLTEMYGIIIREIKFKNALRKFNN